MPTGVPSLKSARSVPTPCASDRAARDRLDDDVVIAEDDLRLVLAGADVLELDGVLVALPIPAGP